MTTRKARRGARRTRHANRMMTVEGLHNTFEKIDDRVRCMIERGKPDSALSCCIRKAWREFFHHDLSGPATEGMIRHYRSVYRAKGAKRTTRRKQRGGMAPLDYTMGQGVTSAVYGRFPIEMGATPSAVRSLDLDRFFESPVGREANSTGGFAPPRQTGGGIFDAIFQPHAPASVPRNAVETGLSSIQGAPIRNPPASPIVAAPALREVGLQPFNPSAISPMTSLAPVYQGY